MKRMILVITGIGFCVFLLSSTKAQTQVPTSNGAAWVAKVVQASQPAALSVFRGASLVGPGPQRGAPPRIRAERIKETEAAADRQLAQAAKGVEANFDPRDTRLVDAFKTAALAQQRYVVSQSPIPAHTKGIKRELLQEVKEAAERVVVEFNEHAGDASFADADIRLLEAFPVALMAVDSIRRTASRAHTKGMKPDQAQAIREAGQSVLGEFNKNGGAGHFKTDDVSTLQGFQKTLRK